MSPEGTERPQAGAFSMAKESLFFCISIKMFSRLYIFLVKMFCMLNISDSCIDFIWKSRIFFFKKQKTMDNEPSIMIFFVTLQSVLELKV